MSGLTSNEVRLDPGAIQVRLGEGRTAEVLRNLCYQLVTPGDNGAAWNEVRDSIATLFGVTLDPPEYLQERGEIEMSYKEQNGATLDISSAGRGLQQTLLLLAYMTANQDSVLLLDEPDAHLEILRQRQIYQILSDFAKRYQSQVIAASHSEVVLNEAADRDVVVAFLGRPHRIDDRGNQLLKSLKEIGFDQYYQAEQTGWILYLEGSTDLAVLRELARILDHPAHGVLDRPFCHYVLNQPSKARGHFFGLREAKADLVGLAIFDNSPDVSIQVHRDLMEVKWMKREIENYLVPSRHILLRWAEEAASIYGGEAPLFAERWTSAMDGTITELENAIELTGKCSPWDSNSKITDDFLDRLFDLVFEKMRLPNLFRKTDYHRLASLLLPEEIDSEVVRMLDHIIEVSDRAVKA